MVGLKVKFCIVAAFFLGGAASAYGADGGPFAVVVNSENPFVAPREEAVQTIRRLYLKFQLDWPDGSTAIGFARPAGSEEETAFRNYVLGMNESRVAGHWLHMKQKRGATPPRAVGATSILLRQLRIRESAFGVVRVSDLSDMSNIRILFEFGEADDDS